MLRYIPFSNGNEFLSWKTNNCDMCSKYEDQSTSYETANCPAAFDIDIGSIVGNIRPLSADKIGYTSKDDIYVTLNKKCKMFKK